MLRLALVLASLALMNACASLPPPSPAARADLAPTGTLRAGINYGNFILAQKDPATGNSRGPAIDLARELGKRLGVPVELVAYTAVGTMVDGAKAGAWDIAFLGSDPARPEMVRHLVGARVQHSRGAAPCAARRVEYLA